MLTSINFTGSEVNDHVNPEVFFSSSIFFDDVNQKINVMYLIVFNFFYFLLNQTIIKIDTQ
jgi:hypothetical protein